VHIGIDFGAKLSGKTVVCFHHNQALDVLQVGKGKDADKWIEGIIDRLKPLHVFVDAPLTLPAAFFGMGNDFFYRKCDRQCHAMSPLFLGGLTACAMAMANRYTNITFIESYPKQVVVELGLEQYYKTHLNGFLAQLATLLPLPVGCEITNWHQADSLLAWLVGHRYYNGEAKLFGDSSEGIIYA
jgi:predicted nuclease with RNAse H fold